MPAEAVKQKVTPTQLLEEMARLTASQLETVIERAALLRLQKRKLVLSERESKLLRSINRGLKAEQNVRLEQLQQKLRQETITPREHKELLRITEALERLGAQRLRALIELAAIRKTSVRKLMEEMGLTEAVYA